MYSVSKLRANVSKLAIDLFKVASKLRLVISIRLVICLRQNLFIEADSRLK